MIEDQVKLALDQLQSSNISEPDRKASQSFLLAFQRNPESWHYLTHWVTSSNIVLQLYALQSLQAKINRDWDELDGIDGDTNSLLSGSSVLDGKERLRDWFLGVFSQLVSGQISFSEGIQHKFTQTLTTLIIRCYPKQISDPFGQVCDTLNASKSFPFGQKLCLELLKELPTEIERYPLSPDLRYKWSHELANNHAKVLEAIRSVEEEAEVDKLGCLTAWIAAGSLPVASLSDDFGRMMHKLSTETDEEYWREAFGLFEEASSSNTIDEATSMSLMQLLIQLEPIFQNEDLKDGLIRVYVAYAESHHDDIFMGFLPRSSDQHKQLSLKFSQLFMQITADDDEELSEMTFNSWHLLHDLAIDEGLPPSQLIASIFVNLTQVILSKAPNASVQYKRDLGDTLICCWRVLGEDGLYPVLMSHSQTNIECVLWAFEAISEEVSKYHPVIGELLSSLPSMASLSPSVRSIAIRLLGKFSHLLSEKPEHAQLLQSSVDLLLGEINATGSLEAVRSIYQVNEDCAGILNNRVETIVQLMGTVKNEHSLLLISKTLGQVVSDIPIQQSLQLISTAIQAIINSVPALTSLIKATSLSTEAAEDISQCQGLVALFQLAQSHIIDANGKPDEDWNELFEALVISCGPFSLNLALPTLHRLHSYLLAKPDPLCLSTFTTILCIYGKDQPDLLLQTLPSLLSAVNIKENADEEVVQAVIDLMSKVSAKYLSVMITKVRIDGHFNQILLYISNRIASGGTISTPFLKSIVRFITTLLNSTETTQWVDTLFNQHGKPLLTALFYAVTNTLPRSQLDTASKLIFEICHRFPQPSRVWIHVILSVEGFPSASYSATEKSTLAKGLAAARSVGKTRQLISDFCQLNKQI